MSSYVPINPNDFMVQDAIKHLNSNIDYLYNNMKSSPIVNGKINLIPYADFTILSNLDYWLPYLSSKLAIKDYNLYAYSSEKIVGVRTPCLIKELEPNTTYSLILKARSNAPEAIFNELYIQKSDNTTIRLNYDKEITGNFNTHHIYFTVDDYYGTVRLIIGTGDTLENDKAVFIPEDTENNPFINTDGGLAPSYDAVRDSYSKEEGFKDTLYYMLVTRDLTSLDYVMSFFKDNEIPSNDMGIKNSLLETFLLNKLKIELEVEGVIRFQDAHIPIFDYLGELYNSAKQVGLIPILKDEDDYSLLLGLYALDMIDTWVAYKGNYIGKDYDLITIRNNIAQFAYDNYNKIYSNGLIKAGIRIEDDKATYSYLDDKNKYSIDTISLFNQVELLRLFIKIGKTDDIETVCNKLLSYKQNDMECVIPTTIKTNGIPVANSEVSITIAAMIIDIVNSYPTAFRDPEGYKENLVTSINTLKTTNGLYKYDYTLDNEVYSNNSYLEVYFKDESYILPRDLYFNSIALYEGMVTDDSVIINQGQILNDLYNKIETSIKRADLTISEDSIIAIVGKQFTTKEYIGKELTSIGTRLQQAELALRPESIIATVTNSNEWFKVNETIETNNVTLLHKLEETNAQVAINSDSITNKVWTKDIQEATNYVVKIGPNLIRNSNFMIPNYRNWTVSDTTDLKLIQNGEGKVWLKCTDPEVVTLTQQCVAYLPIGRCNISFEVYGSGVVGIKVLEGTNNTLAEGFIEGSISSKRYNISFDNIISNCLPKVEISLIGATNLQITNIKLCVGDSDFGWSISSDDFLYLNDSLENISDCITSVDLNNKTLLKEALVNFQKRLDLLSYLFYEWSSHKALSNTDLKKEFINNYNQFINISEKVYQQYYNKYTSNTMENIDPLISEFDNIIITYITYLSKVVEQITLQEADTATNSFKDLVDKDIQGVLNAVEDISQLVTTALVDSTLSSVEKETIQRDLDLLEEDLLGVTDTVDYYNSEISGTVLLLNNLNKTYQEYMTSINDFINQVNRILTYNSVTQDMGYVLNGYADVIRTTAPNMNKALTELVDNYSDSRVTVALAEVRDKADDVVNYAHAINDLITSITEDDVILSLEKDNMSRLLESFANAKVLLTVDVDYFITHPAIASSQEVSNLKSALSVFISNYNKLVEVGLDIVNNNIVANVNLGPWNTTFKEFETVIDTLLSRTKCAIQLVILSSTVKNINLDSVYVVEDALNILLNATKEFYEDTTVTYPEVSSQNEFLVLLTEKSDSLVTSLMEYSKNKLLENTDEYTLLLQRVNEYTNAIILFRNTINSIVSDLSASSDELLKHTLNNYEYKYALSNLQVAMVSAINKVNSLTFTSITGDIINEFIDEKVEEVQDALDDVIDLSNDILLDNIINTSERQALKAVKDILYKEHLDVLKQLDVYLDATLTPELVGQTMLIELNSCRTNLDLAYDVLDRELNNILNLHVVSTIDKTNYNNALETYQERLEYTRELLKESAALISKIDLEGFKSGDFASLVSRVTSAELRITDDSIVSIVESNTTTLVKQNELNSMNQSINKQYESIQSIVSSHTVDLQGITSRVSSAESNITTINGNVSNITTRVNAAEQKITPAAIVSTVTSSQSWTDQTGKITDLTTRVSTAESKITATAITNTVTSSQSWKDQTTNITNAANKANTNATNLAALTTRVSTAENKITADAITSTVTSSQSWKTQTTNITNAQNTANTATTNLAALTTRVSTAEQKITSSAIVSTVTSSTSWTNQTNSITNAQNTANTANSTANSNKTTISTVQSSVTQNANKISWVVASGSSASNMTLTDRVYSLVSNNITLSASRINLNGYISANGNFHVDTSGNLFANKASITGAKIIGSGSGNRILINNGDYEVQTGATTKAFFGMRTLDDSREIPRLAMGCAGLDMYNNNYFIITAYPGGNNPLNSSGNYIDLSYRTHNYSTSDTSGDISNIRMLDDGDIHIAPIRKLLIKSSFSEGYHNSHSNETDIAEFGTYSGDYNRYLDTACIRRTGTSKGIILANYNDAGNSVMVRACIDDSNYRFFAPLYGENNVSLGSPSYLWQRVCASQSTINTSDRRLKDNIEYIHETLNPNTRKSTEYTLQDMYDFIKDDLAMTTYTMKDDEEQKLKYGFIAQDIVNTKVGYNIVYQSNESDFLGYDTMNYANAIAGALKVAIQKIEQLENRINELENNK